MTMASCLFLYLPMCRFPILQGSTGIRYPHAKTHKTAHNPCTRSLRRLTFQIEIERAELR